MKKPVSHTPVPGRAARPTDKLWNANYNKVMATNFLMYFSFYLLMPLLPLYLKEVFGAGKDTIGLVLSGYTLAALIIRPFSGYLVDSYNRKKVMLFCLLLYTLFFAGYFVAGGLVLFAVVRTLHGGPYGACTVANSTLAIDVLPSSRRSEGIGYYGLSNNVATAIAPTVGLFIYKHVHHFEYLFALAMGAALLGALIESTIRIPARALIKNNRPLSLDRFFLKKGWLIGANIAFFGLCFGMLSNYLAIYSQERLGMTHGSGLFFLLLAIGLILSRLQGGRALAKGLLTHNAGVGLIASMAGYLLFVASPHPWSYYLSALLIGLGNGHMYPAFQNMIIDVAYHNERGTANSTLLTAWDVGVGLGVLVGGVVAEHWGYGAAFWTNAGFHLAGLLIFCFWTRAFFRRRSLTASK